MATASVAAGIGRDPYYLGPQKMSQAIKLNSLAFVPGMLALATPKVAVTCLLERLLNPLHSQKWRKVTLYTLSVSCIIFAVILPVVYFAQCKPAAGLWDTQLKARCWNPCVFIDLALFSCCKAFPTSLPWLFA